ncbi:hypothetical protein FOVG_19082 [Fusarium oxysporum f. sp. pisi HDV247]|uniref:Enoyl-CoA hydratase n=2 Tax=Fusarium oxysporum f. sp. pisi HDV247 TaxID=1080344 RepID=W9N9L6_FUSOX|nr:hypothetical protein FOVG_19082 [Fusarium oxysporum f. sp. pisi HDV247]
MSEELVVATTPVARVRVLAFNRPAKRNALSQKLITIFLEHLQEASRDNGVGSRYQRDLSPRSAGRTELPLSRRPLHGDASRVQAYDCASRRNGGEWHLEHI